MRKPGNILKTLFTLAALLGTLLLGSIAPANAEEAKTVAQKGKEVAIDRKKGNCLACHQMDDGSLPGNIGPPLVAMKLRFPDRAVLRAQIWDATVQNPNTIMPPFGRHQRRSGGAVDGSTEEVQALYITAGTILLNIHGSAIDVTVYHLGATFFRQLQSLIGVAHQPLQPALISMNSRHEEARLARTALRGGRYGLWVSLVVAVPVAVLGPELVRL